jgi:hypothetical protein
MMSHKLPQLSQYFWGEVAFPIRKTLGLEMPDNSKPKTQRQQLYADLNASSSNLQGEIDNESIPRWPGRMGDSKSTQSLQNNEIST